MGSTQPLKWVTEDSSSGVERSHIEVDHSGAFSAKVKNGGAASPLLPYVFQT
jgi:hypothetical protein